MTLLQNPIIPSDPFGSSPCLQRVAHTPHWHLQRNERPYLQWYLLGVCQKPGKKQQESQVGSSWTRKKSQISLEPARQRWGLELDEKAQFVFQMRPSWAHFLHWRLLLLGTKWKRKPVQNAQWSIRPVLHKFCSNWAKNKTPSTSNWDFYGSNHSKTHEVQMISSSS